LRQATRRETHFALIEEHLELLAGQLARIPTRKEQARNTLGIIFATAILTTLGVLWFTGYSRYCLSREPVRSLSRSSLSFRAHLSEGASIPRGDTGVPARASLPLDRKDERRFPGYREDHIKPLACGGPDAVWNLQWQTVAEARAKDRWERKTCGH
jgi:hypothetical protein